MTIELRGNWSRGCAYDVHTLSSGHVGNDGCGHDRFSTVRSEMGELVYQLKYRADRTVTGKIVDLLEECEGIDSCDVIVPAPSSNSRRVFQPTDEVALELGRRAGIEVLIDALVKDGAGKALKNIHGREERLEELRTTISLSPQVDVSGKRVLIVDDLYRSGATLRVSTEILYEQGNADSVWVLTMTKTRRIR